MSSLRNWNYIHPCVKCGHIHRDVKRGRVESVCTVCECVEYEWPPGSGFSQ